MKLSEEVNPILQRMMAMRPGEVIELELENWKLGQGILGRAMIDLACKHDPSLVLDLANYSIEHAASPEFRHDLLIPITISRRLAS